jgi:hypothetical protein
MIVGAEKAVTTALLSLLGSHPKINASEQVECPFFTRVDEYEKGNSWLLDQYFSKKEAGNFLVGKHVGLFNNSIGLKRLVKTNKDIIIVTMVRDPIKRAYSAFWYNKMKGRELEDTFEKAVELSEPNFGCLCNAHYMRHIKTVNSLVEQDNHIIITSEDFFQEHVKQAGLILEKLGEFKEQVNVELMWRNEGGKARSIFVNKLFLILLSGSLAHLLNL